jgi:hypothetical protein
VSSMPCILLTIPVRRQHVAVPEDVSLPCSGAAPLLSAEQVSVTTCRFLVGSDSDSDEDDKRVVRSAKDRRGEELRATCDEMRVRCPAGCPGA